MRRADAVSVTFRRQKNRDNGVAVTQHRTDKTGDAEMCPVRALAALVIKLQSYALVRTQGTTNVGINALATDWKESPSKGADMKSGIRYEKKLVLYDIFFLVFSI